MAARTVLLTLGNELVRGHRLDTNSNFLYHALHDCGCPVALNMVMGDDRAGIADAFNHARSQADLVLAAGGLGPTEDDVTRHAIAEALSVPLVENDDALRQIKHRLAQRKRPFAARQARQALVPKGAGIIPNPVGVAPGFYGKADDIWYAALPGVPAELKGMWHHALKPMIQAWFPGLTPITTMIVQFFGVPESQVQQAIIDALGLAAARRIGICALQHMVSVYLTGDDAQHHERVARLFPAHCIGSGNASVESVLVEKLAGLGWRAGTAESLTGGGIGYRLTAVPGASAVFAGGRVVYANEEKRRLGVPASVLSSHGPVSEACARAMAEAVRRCMGVEMGISATGFAGPGDGGPSQPAGTVYIAVSCADKEQVRQLSIRGDRRTVREVTINAALALAIRCLSGL